jgi:hypothetical protein
MSISARLYGWYPSGNGILPLTVVPSGTLDVGVVKVSSNNTVLTSNENIGALMCALYVISGSDAKGWTWVPMKWDWLK